MRQFDMKFSFPGADGKRYKVKYTADEFGYHPITELDDSDQTMYALPFLLFLFFLNCQKYKRISFQNTIRSTTTGTSFPTKLSR